MKPIERQTKLIATIGPATESESNIRKLIEQRVDVMRLNMAHAQHDWIREVTQRIRKIGEELGHEPGILMDVKGPEIRTGYLAKEIEIKRGDLIDLIFIANPILPEKAIPGKLK